MKRVVVGTRGSPLALIQTREVVAKLREQRPDFEFDVKIVRTAGDRSAEAPLRSLGVGIFVKEIEDSLLRGEIDVAVHSHKDLPPQLAPGLTIGAVTERLDPRDVLVNRWNASLDDLPAGARIGTSSPRRAAQLRKWAPQVEVLPIRGNVGTRIAKAMGDDYDGVVLAAAGMIRLGVEERVCQYLPADRFVPPPGQGALAVEVRSDDDANLMDVAKHQPHPDSPGGDGGDGLSGAAGQRLPGTFGGLRAGGGRNYGHAGLPGFHGRQAVLLYQGQGSGRQSPRTGDGSGAAAHRARRRRPGAGERAVSPSLGVVSLVGAGPGDPELITVKGLQRLREADVVAYDRLVDRRLLSEVRENAELIDVGKQAGEGGKGQRSIHTVLIDKAHEGKRVVRLKGGDPFVFGRGGEEAQVLSMAGIPFESCPRRLLRRGRSRLCRHTPHPPRRRIILHCGQRRGGRVKDGVRNSVGRSRSNGRDAGCNDGLGRPATSDGEAAGCRNAPVDARGGGAMGHGTVPENCCGKSGKHR